MAGPTPIELFSGRHLTLSQAARLFPPIRENRPVHPATLWRWAKEGVRLPDGSRLRLQVVRLGGQFVVSEQALRDFVEAQQRQFAAPAPRTAGQRQRASEAAEKTLVAAGL